MALEAPSVATERESVESEAGSFELLGLQASYPTMS